MTISSSTNHQQNLAVIKQHIDKSLGPRLSGIYWDNFSKFLRAKISKREWDYTLRVVLNTNSGAMAPSGAAGRSQHIPHMSISAKPPAIVVLHNYLVKCLLANARFGVSGAGLIGDLFGAGSGAHLHGILKSHWKSWSTFTESPFHPGMSLLSGKFHVVALPTLNRIRLERQQQQQQQQLQEQSAAERSLGDSLGVGSGTSGGGIVKKRNRGRLYQQQRRQIQSSQTNLSGVNNVLTHATQLSNPFTTQSTLATGNATVQLNPRFLQHHFQKTHATIESLASSDAAPMEEEPVSQVQRKHSSILDELDGVHEVNTAAKYGGMLMALADAQQHHSSLYEPTLADRDKIQMRMRNIASDSGLIRGVHDESINLMMRSMEWYLKDIISKCLELKKKNAAELFPVVEDGPSSNDNLDALTQDGVPMPQSKKHSAPPRRCVTPGSYFTRSEQFSTDRHTVLHSYLHYKDDMEEMFEHSAVPMEEEEEEKEEDDNDDDGDESEDHIDTRLSKPIPSPKPSNLYITVRDMLAASEGNPPLFKNHHRLQQKLLLMDWDLSQS